jgi:hypothetical protein
MISKKKEYGFKAEVEVVKEEDYSALFWPFDIAVNKALLTFSVS